MTVKVLIADDHSVVRQGLRTFLALDPEINVVGMARDGAEALQLAHELEPDVILMDLAMPNINGFEATKAIKQKLPQTLILVLSSNSEGATVGQAIEAGANGFLLKSMEADELCRAIKNASSGQLLMSPQAAHALAQQNSQNVLQKHSFEKLTSRETQVLELLAKGQTNKEIAYNLQLSEKTVKIHVSIILAKLGMQSRTQAALQAAKLGLIPLN